VVVPNALDPHQVETHEARALMPWLMARFGRWPRTARLYHRVGAAAGGKLEYDVTPQTPEDVAELAELEGTFVVRVLPAGMDPLTAGIGPLIGAVKWLYDKMIPDVPNIKTPTQRARESSRGSPNNALGRRSNDARADQRIPYILGGVRSIPDLLTVPYTVYVDHVEVEVAYYCVGVGAHIVWDIRDGDMLISQIAGASAEVYGPGDAPTGGLHAPELTIGEPILDDVYTVYEVESVNGQELRGFSDGTFYGSLFPNGEEPAVANLFEYNGDGTGVITLPYASGPDEITERVKVGDALFVFWPGWLITPGGTGSPPDLTTPVTSATGHPLVVTSLTVLEVGEPDPDIWRLPITVSIPPGQQAQWALLATYFAPLYAVATMPYAQVTNLRDLCVGPFFIDFEHPGGGQEFEVVCNFVASRGLCQDDGVTTVPMSVQIQVILTPADASGNSIGTPEAFIGTLVGSAVARGARALTLRCKPTGFTSTRCLVQARRMTNSPRRQRQSDEVEENYYGTDLGADHPSFGYFSGTVTDEIRWTHCYSMSKPGNISFGNVTTLHTRTVATGALREKTRQLNCFASRKIQTWDGSTFGGVDVASSRAENVLFTIMKDPTIGNLADSYIDFAGIARAFEAVRASVWSSTELATSFNFTFDEIDVSFEETLQAICQACFAVAYRRGNVLSVRPEVAGDDSVLLFNHRNVLSGSQRVTHTFGPPTENDSIEVGYVNPLDDRNDKITVPKFGPRLRPKQVKVVGLRDAQQAYWHGYRALHKMLHQRQSMTLEAMAEAQLVGARERVLIADETRAGVQTGQVTAISDGLLRTSQPVVLAPGKAYQLHLQGSDGTVKTLRVLSAPSAHEIQVAESLAATIYIVPDPNQGVMTTYLLVPSDAPAPTAFLVSSVTAATPMTHQVEAVNYSHLYYLADGLTTWVDFAHGLSDLSPVQRLFTNTGGALGGGYWTGDLGDKFAAISVLVPDTSTPSYSKALWITALANPTNSGLIQSSSDDSEQFAITVGNLLVAGHGGALQVSADYTDLVYVEHLVGVTYDGVTGRMALFVDGALLDEATAPPVDYWGSLDYLHDFQGQCRMLLKWGRALSDREMMEIYLRTRL
jgi:hypothetical protein